jgi:hypothetical protein
MNRIFLSTIISFFCISFSAYCTIINIPADYPTIQQGINASSDGDTVLVQPGTYVENINFNGHNIVLGSLFLTTGDTSHISTTIIDGDSAGTVVIFENGETNAAMLIGFSIRNGLGGPLGPERFGGGITCKNQSNPIIENNWISDNSSFVFGGGLLCDYSSPIIRSNVITNNFSIGNPIFYYGGGIYCDDCEASIINNIIAHNRSCWGGGIALYYSNIIIEGNVFYGNLADP